MRKKIYDIIKSEDHKPLAGRLYDWINIAAIVISLIPMMSKSEPKLFYVLDRTAVSFFIIDYILRIGTADMKLGKGKESFLLYPFTPMAIIDLLAILPSFTNSMERAAASSSDQSDKAAAGFPCI